MIEQLKTYDTNALAIEVIDGFTESDEKLCQKWFAHKLEQGFEKVHVLVKLDEMKIGKSSTKAFFEDIVWVLRNYRDIGNIAIVAHSNILKALVPIDNLFFSRLSKGYEERYFDSSQLEQAFAFLTGSTENP
jgi:hypothetical protein